MNSTFEYSISIIIVNYNVEFFLEQCLNSVEKALLKIDGEVFVVDNNSIDGSVQMVKDKFPNYHLIENKDNVGFSTANNQAIKLSRGEFILLLNPDTVIEEDTLEKVIAFMKSNEEAGGLGVRMVDGKGVFLPESKRGLPTPNVAFYKIFGLSKLFPSSKKFGKYHLGYLSEFETNEVDILSGAFMLMRKKTLDKVGLLDEAFFMYGEDVDLSYRIQKGGYKNYYFPETRIIHYKGESTKKSSVNYVFVFYRAMVIFAEKHFSQKNAKIFSVLINGAIYLRAFIAILSRFLKKLIIPFIDFFSILLTLYLLSHLWKDRAIEFPLHIINIIIPIYTITWLISNYFSGSYDKPIKLFRFIKGTLIGTFLILVFYALLSKEWQFSRLFIIIGSATTFAYYSLSRILFSLFLRSYSLKVNTIKNFVIIGSQEEIERVESLINITTKFTPNIFTINTNSEEKTINQLDQIVYIHKINEVIFCAKDITAQEIIEWMIKLNSDKIEFKIAQPESLFLIGSNSIDKAGEVYSLNINAISSKSNIRNKRTFDFITALILLTTFPIISWFFKLKKNLFLNLLTILIGQKTFVGYNYGKYRFELKLPKIKPGVLLIKGELTSENNNLDKLNLIYARDYSVYKDFMILIYSWRNLDSKN